MKIAMLLVIGALMASCPTVQSSPHGKYSSGPDRFKGLELIYTSCLRASVQEMQEFEDGFLDADPEGRRKRFEAWDRAAKSPDEDKPQEIVRLEQRILACGKKIDKYPEKLVMEWLLHKKVENSLIMKFFTDVFTDSSGNLVDDEKPLKPATLIKLQKGLSDASKLLKYWHNFFLSDIQKQFPSAKPIEGAFETRLCNSPDGYHEFVCNPQPDCGLTSGQGVITSSRAYKGVVRGLIYSYNQQSIHNENETTAEPLIGLSRLKRMLNNHSNLFRVTGKTNKWFNILYEISSQIRADQSLADAIDLGMKSADLMPYYNNLILFMLAHEQGHIVLQKEIQCNVNEDIDISRNKSLELEADAYGAYLLGRIYSRFNQIAAMNSDGRLAFEIPKFDALFLQTSYAYAGFENTANYPSIEERFAATQKSMSNAMKDAISATPSNKEGIDPDGLIEITLYAVRYLGMNQSRFGYLQHHDIYHFRLGFLLKKPEFDPRAPDLHGSIDFGFVKGRRF